MKKRGISAVVATILIILIVVVGVGIVWKVVLPLFAELEFLSYSDVQLNIVRQGFTVYDEEQNFAFVQIERGKDEVNVTGIEIGFNFDGTTKTYQSDNVPTPNGRYTYKFNFTNDSDMGIPQNVTPDRVTVAPIFTINNKVRLGKILDSEDMPVGRIRLSVAEWEKANNESAIPIVVTTGSGGGDEPGEPVVPEEPEVECGGGEVEYNGGCAIEVTECETLIEEGRTYLVQNFLSFHSFENCITIGASDITLDLNGNYIRGSGGLGTYAIGNFGYDNFVVYNGGISAASRGISISDSSGHKISNISFDDDSGIGDVDRAAIYFENVDSSFVDNITINNWGMSDGDSDILLLDSDSNIFNNINIDSRDEQDYGVRLSLGSDYNSFSNLNVKRNRFALFIDSSSHNLFKDVALSGWSSDVNLEENSINITVVNGTYFEINEHVEEGSNLTRAWYYRARFVYKGDGLPLVNLNITIDDEYYSSTDSEGWIPQHELTGYIKQGTSKQPIYHSIVHDSAYYGLPAGFGINDNMASTYELLLIM